MHKNRLEDYKKTPNQPVMLWQFGACEIFQRLNAYLARLRDVQSIFDAAFAFFRLEKIEIGGNRGKILNQKLRTVFREFQMQYNKCIIADHNILEPANEKFNRLRNKFHRNCIVLERKLAQILYEAFDDCLNIEASFKLIEMVGSLAQRSLIHSQISIHFVRLFDAIHREIDIIEALFCTQQLNNATKVRFEFNFVDRKLQYF